MNSHKSVTAYFVQVSKPKYTLSTYVSPSGGGSVSPGGGTYDEGTSVTLTAYPNSGWKFDRWGGGASGYSSSTNVYMNSNKSVTAYFVKEIQKYTLSTYVSPSGSGSINPSGGTYDEGTNVTLTAYPSSGWRFDHWEGGASGYSSSTNVYMNSNKSVTAYFVKEIQKYTLSTYVSPSGSGSINPSGGTYDPGTNVTLNAYSNSGWNFIRWGGDASGSNTSTSVYMNSDKSVSAYFEAKEEERPQYKLTIEIVGCGHTNPPADTYTKDAGERVTVQAEQPCDGWEFDCWWVNDGGWQQRYGEEVTVKMDRPNMQLRAEFKKKKPSEYKLTIKTKGCGTTDPKQGTYTYNAGDWVEIRAEPCEGWRFSGWWGAGGDKDSVIIKMDEDREVMAEFFNLANEITCKLGRAQGHYPWQPWPIAQPWAWIEGDVTYTRISPSMTQIKIEVNFQGSFDVDTSFTKSYYEVEVYRKRWLLDDRVYTKGIRVDPENCRGIGTQECTLPYLKTSFALDTPEGKYYLKVRAVTYTQSPLARNPFWTDWSTHEPVTINWDSSEGMQGSTESTSGGESFEDLDRYFEH